MQVRIAFVLLVVAIVSVKWQRLVGSTSFPPTDGNEDTIVIEGCRNATEILQEMVDEKYGARNQSALCIVDHNLIYLNETELISRLIMEHLKDVDVIKLATYLIGKEIATINLSGMAATLLEHRLNAINFTQLVDGRLNAGIIGHFLEEQRNAVSQLRLALIIITIVVFLLMIALGVVLGYVLFRTNGEQDATIPMTGFELSRRGDS